MVYAPPLVSIARLTESAHALGCVAMAAVGLACTTTTVEGGVDPARAPALGVGAIEVEYGEGLPPDRARRSKELGIAEQLAGRVERWMSEAGTWGGSDRVLVSLDRFRLPASGRWATGQAQGNDYLGVAVEVMRGEDRIASFDVEHRIGAADRSIAENYSADRALENLVDAVAWSILYETSGDDDREAVFEIGKREQVERAIEMLERCGKLSYAEATKFAALGKLGIDTAAGAEYRRLKRLFGGELPRCY